MRRFAAVEIEADYDALEACAKAGELLRAAGFIHTYTSMQSESCYYALPDYRGVIRVSARRFGRTERRAAFDPVVATVTFGTNQGRLDPSSIYDGVYRAVGKYFMARLTGTCQA